MAEKFPGLHRKRRRKLHNILKGDVSLTAFHSTDVVAMKPGTFGELLLREPSFLAQASDGRPETELDWRGRHSSMVRS